MLSNRSKLVFALTEWDRNQSARKGHNPHFIGIALGAIESAPDDLDVRETILARFNGRLVPFLLSRMGEPPLTEAEYRRVR